MQTLPSLIVYNDSAVAVMKSTLYVLTTCGANMNNQNRSVKHGGETGQPPEPLLRQED